MDSVITCAGPESAEFRCRCDYNQHATPYSPQSRHYLRVLQCIWNRTADWSYAMFVAIVLIAGPLCAMLATNVRMICYIHATKRNVLQFQDDDRDRQRDRL